MCGRFTLTSPAQIIGETFGVEPPEGLAARYNIAPGQAIMALRRASAGSHEAFAFLHWGLVPSWSKEAPRDARMINARSETVAEKPSFRDAFRSRRCLIPLDGFFEWRREVGARQPYLIRRKDLAPFAIAGLWERWRRDGQKTLESCALLTTTPNELMQPIHDRMPVLLPPQAWERWLDPEMRDAEELRGLLRPAPAEEMEAFAVCSHVNNPRNDDSGCLERYVPRTLFDN